MPCVPGSGESIELRIQVELNRLSFPQAGTLHIFMRIFLVSVAEERGIGVPIGITITRHSSFSGVFL